ncbi:hypothetical protein TanjilG_12381 [Lupinus angustifolius]|uniref:Uncharacterized protein n=2 Tax=Lupinus angustifolius TaxID=3871 RepID=A0A4P1QYV4_LUPAN|nr:hypothetical protein TanjilG_12381 [Lupinus angustifolius]
MKELSVAIAEASSIQGGEKGQKQVQSQAPRKRGRPRKIIVMERTQEKKIEAASTAEKSKESSMKKEQEKQQQQQEESATATEAACISINRKEEEFQLPKEEPSRNRARRKSKPRKST